MSAPVPAIRVRHLWHRFGNFDVLRDVSFEVAQGEIFGFIGPNGAGKTTTIRVMATLLEPLSGRVEVDGIDVALEPERVRRVIGYMPDHAGVYERITIREFLEFFADAYAVPDRSVVSTVIELTELGKLQDRLVADLSKGMKQRLQIARILLHDPKVLVLDEPASDLDPRARIEVRDLLLELRDLGKTIFLSSHILTELSDVCTSIGILERGSLVVAGPIGEIAERLAARNAPVGEDGKRLILPPQAPFRPAAASDPSARLAPSGTSPPTVETAGGVAVPPSARRRLRLRVIGDSRAVVPLIEGGGGVLGVEPGPGGQLTVHYVGDERFVAEVVRHLVSRGVGIVGVEPERNELERIFLEVTKGDLQ
ncbi:MAG TPA: ABC transporter ATP-binding protein [Polyangiaceae bacterium]|nr:ABC transporter ATP-binding protein [Polyangiaceae bacterium]